MSDYYIGKKIKYYREKAGLTQFELAEGAKIHRITIAKYETNTYMPAIPQLDKICCVFNISLSEFFDKQISK